LLYVPLKLLSVLDQDFSLGPWTFRGYVQFDGADYTPGARRAAGDRLRRGPIGSGDAPNARALADGSYLRKARLGGEGQWGENLSYRAMFDIGGRDEQGEARIAEVWARYSRFAPYVLIVGAYPQLANMEDATSTDANPFPGTGHGGQSGAGPGRRRRPAGAHRAARDPKLDDRRQPDGTRAPYGRSPRPGRRSSPEPPGPSIRRRTPACTWEDR
jgi:hypothetical protein